MFPLKFCKSIINLLKQYLFQNVVNQYLWSKVNLLINFYNNKLGKKSNALIQTLEKNYFDTTGTDLDVSQDIKRDEYSYAFAQNIDYKNGYKRWSHSGSWVAYTAQYSRFPELEFSVIVLCNNESIDASDIANGVMEIYFQQHEPL